MGGMSAYIQSEQVCHIRRESSMSETFYKPLTPSLRTEINASIEKSISELRTCKSNVFVNMQIAGYEQTKRLINGLPDGYPMPMTRN